VLVAALLSSCAPAPASQPATTAPTSGSQPTPAASGQVTLNFIGAEPEETFKTAIAQFQQKNPGITVVYNSVPFADLSNTLQSRLGAQDPSLDVYMADEPTVPSLASRNFLVPLEQERQKLESSVAREALEAVTWDGKIYSLPISTSTAVLFYNKKFLSGAAAPSMDTSARWTWEQTIDAARKAQQAGARSGFSFQQVDRYYQLQVLPESLGAGPGLTGADLLTPAVTSDGWVRAMEWYWSTFNDGVSPRGVAVGQIPDLFANGELAIMVGNPIYIQKFAQTQGLEYGVAPQPFFANGKAVTPTDGWSLGISPYSTHRDEALRFLEFLALDPEGTTAWSAGRSLTPANTQAFDKWTATLAQQGGAQTQGIDTLIRSELSTTAIHRPRTIGYVAFEGVMNRAFADIRNGSDARQRLEQAQQELTSTLGRLKG
jgi:multiple sugar transport system substrate-binding protein